MYIKKQTDKSRLAKICAVSKILLCHLLHYWTKINLPLPVSHRQLSTAVGEDTNSGSF